MNKGKGGAFAVGALLLAAVGCAHRAPPQGAAPPVPPAQAAPSSLLSATDRELLQQMAQGGLYEVEAGRLALQRASSGAIRSYAQMLVNHHTAVNKELALLLQAKQLAGPTRLAADKQARLKHLQQLSGAAFDRDFIRLAGIEDHRAHLAVFQRAASEAQDADVKAWAAKTLPTLRGHLQQAQALAATLAG